MDPIDLTAAPPRSAREALADVVLLPRTIDKVRATLPGGAPGEYTIPGLSQMMLDRLEIELTAFTAAVGDAQNDAAVAQFLTAATTPERVATWNAWILARRPRGGDRNLALESYPWLAERPDLPLVLDVLEEDDRRHFARRT